MREDCGFEIIFNTNLLENSGVLLSQFQELRKFSEKFNKVDRSVVVAIGNVEYLGDLVFRVELGCLALHRVQKFGFSDATAII